CRTASVNGPSYPLPVGDAAPSLGRKSTRSRLIVSGTSSCIQWPAPSIRSERHGPVTFSAESVICVSVRAIGGRSRSVIGAALVSAARGPAPDQPALPVTEPPSRGTVDRHVRGHLQVLHPLPRRDTVAKRPHDQPSVGRPPPGAWLVHDSGHVLTRIAMLAGGLAPLHVVPGSLKAGVDLPPAVERCHYHVPALMARRVVPVVMDDVPPQVVVVGVNSGHDVKSGIRGDADPASTDAQQAASDTSSGRKSRGRRVTSFMRPPARGGLCSVLIIRANF